MPRRTALNISANVVGRAWLMLMSFAFVPVYLHILGIEAYGIIGFFATLTAMFSILDLGLSATLNREMARRSALADELATMPTVLRTLEVIYWATGAVIGLIIFVAAPFIATDWLHAQKLPTETIISAIRLMGLAVAFQWPIGLYTGGLLGLQRQVEANGIDIAIASARGIGVIPILWWVSPRLDTYFAWQIVVSAVGVLAMRTVLWRVLPKASQRPRIDLAVFRSIWRFAAGMTGISVVSLLLVQADKVVLSATLPLEAYAHYVLAGAIAAACGFMAPPISMTIYPKLTQLVAVGDRTGVARVYHDACAMVALAVVPLVLTVALFSREVILFWTRNEVLAAQASPIASLLAIGTGINNLAVIPYMLILANGATRIPLIFNSIAACIVVPLVYFLGTRYGAVGAAFAWPLLNATTVLVLLPVIHRRFVPGATRGWYLIDIGIPVIASLPTLLLARWFIPTGLSPTIGFLAAGGAGAVALGIAVLATPRARQTLLQMYRTFGAAVPSVPTS